MGGGETSDNIHILLYFKNWNLTTSLILREKVTSSKMFLLETKFKNRLEIVIKIKFYVILSWKLVFVGEKTWGKLNLCNMHIRKWKVPVVNLNKLYKMVFNQHTKDLVNIYVQVKLLKAPFLSLVQVLVHGVKVTQYHSVHVHSVWVTTTMFRWMHLYF